MIISHHCCLTYPMKLSILTLVVASVGLANANPLRLLIVEGGAAAHPNGPLAVVHSSPAHLNGAVAAHPHLPAPGPFVQGGVVVLSPSADAHKAKQGCGARLRQKATGLAHSIKVAFGFKTGGNAKTAGGDDVHIVGLSGASVPPHVHAHHAHHKHRPHHLRPHGAEQPSFLMRFHYALMSLGPWEGRAVAFVLGCGIGVLLRMFFVLTVLAVRGCRAPSSASTQEEDYYYAGVPTHAEADAEEIFVAPPMYTVPVLVDAQGYPVEKVEAEESK
ncbi:F-box domain-containing protein [Mycena kentingensis (nom. inval.)]|nr:F-box domain-containing protein [Mycena kentingensis (nom. inval.)]